MDTHSNLTREQGDALRLENKIKAEKLIQRAETLAKSGDARSAINSMHELRQLWRETVHPLPRDCADSLWEKFNSVITGYIEKMEAAGSRRAMEVIQKAERLAASTEWVETARKMNRLRDEWKSIYPIPKEERELLWERFNGTLNRFFKAREEDCRKSAEETIAEVDAMALTDEFDDDEGRKIRNLKSKLSGALHVLPDEEKISLQNRLNQAVDKYEIAKAKREISKLQQEIVVVDTKIEDLENQLDTLAHDNFKRRDELENLINDMDRVAAQNEFRIEELQKLVNQLMK